MTRTGAGCLGWIGLVLLCLPLHVAAAESPAASTSGPGDTYVVKKGDTLWGIARDLLHDPVLWPRLWEQNRYIADPDRIYPGTTLSLPGREFAPAPVVEAPKVEPLIPEPPKVTVPPAPVATPPPPPPPLAPETTVEVEPPVPPASSRAIACSPILVSEGAALRAGRGNIIQSEDGKLILSQEDDVIVGLDPGRTVTVGDTLAVIRIGDRVVHPTSRISLGRILHTEGILVVQEVRDRTVRARVIVSCEAINTGDRVAEFNLAHFPEGKIARPATRTVEGVILNSASGAESLALQEVVFLNVGKDQGIVPGDIFAIYRTSVPAANPQMGQQFPVPPERLGEAVIVRVTDATSTAVITASSKESRDGDPVVLSRQIQP
jgi:LysM repeat protein